MIWYRRERKRRKSRVRLNWRLGGGRNREGVKFSFRYVEPRVTSGTQEWYLVGHLGEVPKKLLGLETCIRNL